MHMNSAPHLLAEDRPEFERVLDLALRSADRDPEISALIAAEGRRLDTEQLRIAALRAIAVISAPALTEYRNYVRAREELRHRSATVGSRTGGTGGGRREPDGPAGPGAGPDRGTPAPGAGAGAVLTVLAPLLAGIAAFLFLLIGYALKAVGTEGSVARPMVTAGWWFAGLTAAGALIAMGALLLTALRNGRPGAPGTGASGAGTALASRPSRPADVDRARDAWHEALLHRGVLPFLREALADAPVEPDSSYVPGPRDGGGRTSRLGFSSPGFSSHEEQPGPHLRPRFTSPDFTGPEFGGSDGRE
ncbi:hypothetical protein ACSNOK_19670 [Streptomyces sp. URMC 126]|uniref:hypothetical protein n=1 Tax=Streptomyces sp. URMC 126 TaxID=3423401 RepID=UPI003F1A6CF8